MNEQNGHSPVSFEEMIGEGLLNQLAEPMDLTQFGQDDGQWTSYAVRMISPSKDFLELCASTRITEGMAKDIMAVMADYNEIERGVIDTKDTLTIYLECLKSISGESRFEGLMAYNRVLSSRFNGEGGFMSEMRRRAKEQKKAQENGS